MAWIQLLLAIVALGIAWWTPSVLLMVACLLVALGLLLAFAITVQPPRPS